MPLHTRGLMTEPQKHKRINRRLKIARMLENWDPDTEPVTDEFRITEQRLSLLNKRELGTWRRISKKLGSDVISVSRVRSILTARDQDALYRILQKMMAPK